MVELTVDDGVSEWSVAAGVWRAEWRRRCVWSSSHRKTLIKLQGAVLAPLYFLTFGLCSGSTRLTSQSPPNRGPNIVLHSEVATQRTTSVTCDVPPE